jgi:hypothetical protein
MSKADPSDKTRIGDPEEEGKLPEEQIKVLRAEADRYRQAQRQVLEALGVLWNAQLDVSIAEGRASSIQRILTRPVEFYDNCNCGGGTGPACW